MTFLPDVDASPGWFWGWDAVEGPCGDLTGLLTTDDQVASFEDSPFGFTWDLGGAPHTFSPYEIDAATLKIQYRPDLAITAPNGPSTVLDDSTMIVEERGATTGTFPFQHFTHSLYVVSRSGIAIALTGPQQSADVSANVGSTFICRIDDTHFVRAYVPYVPVTGATGAILETFSVSGGTISLDLSEDLTPPMGGWIVTRDPGGGTASLTGLDFLPFHYDGSGLLYVYTQSLKLTGPPPVSPVASAHFVVAAVPYTPGGGVLPIGTSARANDDHDDLITRAPVYAAKFGSPECVLLEGGARIPFSDNGSNMAFGTTDVLFGHVDHGTLAGDTSQGNYLASSVSVSGGDPIPNVIIDQSGTVLSYSPIVPLFLCPQFGQQVAGVRQGPNLGLELTAFGGGQNLLRAYSW